MSSSASQIPLSAVAARKALREAQAREAAKALDEEAKVRRKKQRLQRQTQQQSNTREDADRGENGNGLVNTEETAQAVDGMSNEEDVDARSGTQGSPLKREKRKASDNAFPSAAVPAKEQAQSAEEVRTAPLFRPIWRGDGTNVVKTGDALRSLSTLLVAIPTGHALPFRGIVELSVKYGTVVVQGAVLNPSSPARTFLFGAARYPCPAPVAVSCSEGSPSSLPADLLQHFPHHDADCAIVQLAEVPPSLRTIENLGRYFPLPGVEATFGLKTGTDLWTEAGLPSLPGFRFIGSGTVSSPHTNASDIIDLTRSWEYAIQQVLPTFLTSTSGVSQPDQPKGSQSAPMRMMIRGPRGVGKSTFARTLLNAARTTTTIQRWAAVAFLDLDIGQTEFGPPGMMSLSVFPTLHQAGRGLNLLVGPAWATPERPTRAHFLGDTSPKNIPSAYMEAASDLIRFYREHVADGNLLHARDPPNHQQSLSTTATPGDSWQSRSRRRQRSGSTAQTAPRASAASDDASVPLIVNTQGWISGLGADLLAQIESILQPTHVFDFSAEEPYAAQSLSDGDQAPLLRMPSSSGSAHVIHVQPTPSAVGPAAFIKSRLNAADQRSLMLLSYLHMHTIPDSLSSSSAETVEASLPHWKLDKTLLSIAPIVVDITQGVESGIHVLPFGAAVEERLRLHALNGSIVAIVEDVQELAPHYINGTPAHAGSVWTAALRKPTPRPSTSRCLGLGLVRSINRARHELHIVGPLESLLSGSRFGLDEDVRLGIVKGAIDLPVQGTLDPESLEFLRRPHLISSTGSGRRAGPSYQEVNGQPESGAASGEDDEDEEMDEGPEEALPLSGLSTCGVPVENLPYLEWPSNEVVAVAGAKKRRVRRNLQRRAH